MNFNQSSLSDLTPCQRSRNSVLFGDDRSALPTRLLSEIIFRFWDFGLLFEAPSYTEHYLHLPDLYSIHHFAKDLYFVISPYCGSPFHGFLLDFSWIFLSKYQILLYIVLKVREGDLWSCHSNSDTIRLTPYLSRCDEDGAYLPLQCSWDECWCVTPLGTRVATVPYSLDDTVCCE